MIKSITGKTTRDLFDGVNSKAARKVPVMLHERARDLLDMIQAATDLGDLKTPPSNRLHQLKDDFKGFWSVSINDQYRIIFRWVDGHAEDVEITDYH